ncbi:hypothetical protein [Deinococcus depolymerans]|uniref:hypothetical protein n=1 Tax=Deinococcus depolymerans TaxID=392408 RepID=UPI0031CED75D
MEVRKLMNRIAPDKLSLGFLDYILFNPWFDKDDEERIICSAEILHALDKTSHLIKNHRSEVGARLEHFQAVLAPDVLLKIHPGHSVQRRATTVTAEFGANVLRIRELHQEHIRSGQPTVDVLTGRAITQRQRQALRNEYRELGAQAVAEAREIRHPLADELDYLNSQPPNYFSRLETNFPEVERRIRQLPPKSMETNFRILQRLRIHPQPLYKAALGSPRLYTIGFGLQNMSKSVRAVLMPDCVSLDLEAAQFAVVAAVWGIPSIQEALQTGSAWEVIMGEIHSHFPHIKKSQVKSVLYPLIFGMPKHSLAQRIQHETRITAEEFFNASVTMQTLLSARETRMDLIRKNGGIVDATGRTHSLQERQEREDTRQDRAIRSLLAYEAQSYEVELMRPLLNFIRENARYLKLNLFIHDGVYVQFTAEADEQRRERLLVSMQNAVQSAAQKLGVVTRLTQE